MKDKVFRIIITGFYIGDCPRLKGTLGTLEGVLLYALIVWLAPAPGRDLVIGFVILLLSVLCLSIGSWAERYYQQKDPPSFILDEIAGFLVACIFSNPAWLKTILLFSIFRVLDIIKPFPIKKAQVLPGGSGILLDDLIAGFFANLFVQIINRVSPHILS